MLSIVTNVHIGQVRDEWCAETCGGNDLKMQFRKHLVLLSVIPKSSVGHFGFGVEVGPLRKINKNTGQRCTS